MKATAILSQAKPCIFEAWATTKTGVVRRLEVEACSQAEALSKAFALVPDAGAMSVREADRPTLRDALAELDRRAGARS